MVLQFLLPVLGSIGSFFGGAASLSGVTENIFKTDPNLGLLKPIAENPVGNFLLGASGVTTGVVVGKGITEFFSGVADTGKAIVDAGSQVTKGVSNVTGAITDVGKSVSDTTRNVTQSGTEIVGAGSGAVSDIGKSVADATAGIAGSVAGFTDSIAQSSGLFTKAFGDIGATVGQTGQQLGSALAVPLSFLNPTAQPEGTSELNIGTNPLLILGLVGAAAGGVFLLTKKKGAS